MQPAEANNIIPLKQTIPVDHDLDDLIPVISSVIYMIISKLPEAGRMVEDGTGKLSTQFIELANSSRQQAEQLDKIIDIASELDLDGSKITIAQFADMFNNTLGGTIGKILQVSKLAMSMVYSLDDTIKSISKIEHFVSRIEKINRQTHVLSINAAIESERAGEIGKGFAVVSGEMRQISEQITSLSKEINASIQLVAKHANESFSTLKEVASSDMSDSINAKEKLDTLLESLLQQSKKFKEFLHESSEGSKKLSDTIMGMTISMQFQDVTSQYIENSVNSLTALNKILHERYANQHQHIDGTKVAELSAEILDKLKLSDFKKLLLKQLRIEQHLPAENTANSQDNIELF